MRVFAKSGRPLCRVLAALAITWAATFSSGCGSIAKSAGVRVVPSAPPAISAANSLPTIPDTHPELPLIVSERDRFTDPHILKFIAARDAFWNYDTDTAVKLLRELLAEETITAEHFHALVLQCYEQSERWADAVPLFTEFGLEESHAGWLQFAKFRASLPARRLEFAPESVWIPMTLKYGDLPIAEAEINGVKARVLIDTGAGISWISEGFARRAGVEVSSQTVSLYDSNDSAVDTPLALVRQLRIGGVTVRDMPALVGRSLLLQLGTGVDGILGWEILQHTEMTFDFPAQRMTLVLPSDPMSPAPNLSGRSAPILTVLSTAGRPLHLYLDTGASAGRAYVDLFDNDGIVATKTPIAQFSLPWRPTFGAGIHSLTVSWPRLAKPFEFWMAGYRFEVPTALLYKRSQQKERLAYVDGLVGNAPFLGGKLTICGVRRLVRFEPRAAEMPAATAQTKR